MMSVQGLRKLLFENQGLRQTIAKNTFWLSVGEFTGRVLRVAVIIYAARLLGPSEWGAFSYALSLAALLTIFSDIGLGAILVREGIKSPELRSRYASTILLLKLGLAALSFAFVFWGAPAISKIALSRPLVFAIALLVVFDSLRGFTSALFRATERMEREAFTNIVTQALILLAGLFALFSAPNGETLAAAYAVGAGGGLLFAVSLLRSHGGELIPSFDSTLIRTILRTSWPLSIVGILGAIMINADTAMIGWLMNEEAVGFYAAAQKPILFLYLIPSLVAGGVFPALSRFAGVDRDRFRRVLESGLKAVYLVALPAAVGLFLTAEEVSLFLYGAPYASAAAPLRVLGLSLLTAFPMSLVVNGIFAYDKQRALIRIGFVGVVGNIVLNFFLIPIWGTAGAAWATVVTQLVTNGGAWLVLRKANFFSVLPGLQKTLAATATMSVGVLLLEAVRVPFAGVLLGAAALYFAALLALREEFFGELKKVLL